MAAEPGGISLRTGDATLALYGPAPDLAGFVADANRRRRMEGLPDPLNPGIIDPDKLAALVAALPAQPAAVRNKLAGQALYLDTANLGVTAVEPTTPATFTHGYALVIEQVAGSTVVAHATFTPDLDRARQGAAAAQAAYAEADKAARAFERRSGPMTAEEGQARARRGALAQAWRINAKAWHAAAPADKAAAAALKAAETAVAQDPRPGGANAP